MLQFWVLAALLITLALLFLVEPLIRARRHRLRQQRLDEERQQQNVAIFRERLAELDADKAAGQLDEAQYDALRQELEVTLISDVDGMNPELVTQERRSRLGWLALVLVLAMPLTAIGLYSVWGAYEQLQQRHLMAQMEQGEGPKVEELLAQLEGKLRENPNNPDGWFMLARTQMSLGEYGKAAAAFLKLAQLLEPNPAEAATIYGLQAQALYFANQGRFDEPVRKAVDEAFKRNPNEINALGLLGIQAFEEANYADAARYWQRVLDVSPDSPNAETIRAGIARAQQLMAQSGQAAEVPDSAAAAPADAPEASAPPSLQVSVSLSPQLAEKADPADTLFIYARAVNGPRMPLSIVRKRVADLPLQVTLDDSTAMGPMAKLSSVPQVEVIARVSKQGTPAPNSGDLEGIVSPVALKSGAQAVQVEISEQVP